MLYYLSHFLFFFLLSKHLNLFDTLFIRFLEDNTLINLINTLIININNSNSDRFSLSLFKYDFAFTSNVVLPYFSASSILELHKVIFRDGIDFSGVLFPVM